MVVSGPSTGLFGGAHDGEQDATRRAMSALDAYGRPYDVLRVAVTDTRDIKVRRPG
ncbi:hypothetical protein [Nonomuraea sp. B19D2]|uniref:hypothetical protein n=1 Tax=Nonomuraea sp. B19D2 TaxID=3159561 RepID=UPI0032D9C6DB